MALFLFSYKKNNRKTRNRNTSDTNTPNKNLKYDSNEQVTLKPCYDKFD